MTDQKPQLAILRDSRLAAHALAPTPVWLWSPDADRILWANPAGAAIFDAASPGEVALLRFDANHSVSVQVARLSRTLLQVGTPRLERLRGFGATIGATLVCLCSRVALADNSAAILIVSAERAGKTLALPDRAIRLLRDLGPAAAIFTSDGEIIAAQPAAIERMGNQRDLAALGAEKLAREASLNDRAEGEIKAGHLTMIKLGAGSTFALLVTFTEPAGAQTNAVSDTAKVSSPVELQPQPRPFRFVWQTDAETHFTLTTQEFVDLLGPKSAAVLGRSWAEIAKTLALDPSGEIANALSRHETFSGIVTAWPIDGLDQPLAIEMSGLPLLDSERRFGGFRGFGLCRDVERLRDLPSQKLAQSPGEPTKVLAFPAPPPAPAGPPLSPKEHSAFQELARELSDRLRKASGKPTPASVPPEAGPEPAAAPIQAPLPAPGRARDTVEDRSIFDRLPTGILIYRHSNLVYANRAFLGWTGYATLDELTEAGGLDSLFIEPKKGAATKDASGARALMITTSNGRQKPVEGRLLSVTWGGESSVALIIETQSGVADRPVETPPQPADKEIRELRAILDTATDGVLILDGNGRVLSGNRSAQALFGYDARELEALSLGDLLVPESRRPILDHLDRLSRHDGVESLGAGHEAIGRVRQGGLVPLHITIGRIEDGEKLCAVLRDVTAWKRIEEELINARRSAEKASTAKSELLAKISHEIRTPLNAIIGFSEVMMDERFGPIGSERYRQYLKDIHASGAHLISLVNDLLDLSKVEAGKLELTFVSVNLNDLVQQCVAIMQQQANRERVIIRTSLHHNLPQIVADVRAMRQIMLNLLSNSIKFTGAGGQVIISTAQTDDHEVVLRVRDTGPGMSEKELQIALEPFGQVPAVTRWDSGGTGLGLPITKALAEANHAYFRITSRVDDGTLAEVIFPATRVLAQ